MYRYKLDKSSRKFACPNCDKRRFVRYIETETQEYMPDHFGRCDREISCGEHNSPIESLLSDAPQYIPRTRKSKIPRNKKDPIYIPHTVLHKTRGGYDKNVFIQNLLSHVPYPFKIPDIENVIALYHLGTVQNGYRTGATTFPFIDTKGNVRTIQAKKFDTNNRTVSTDFLHSIIEKYYFKINRPLPQWLNAYNNNDTKVSCLFGEHLLDKYPHNPIALVEAPKTAIYGTLYFGCPKQPQDFLWLAVYNLSSLSLKKCTALIGRDVYLFPDLSKGGKAFDLWSNKAKYIQSKLPRTVFKTSDLLEQLAPELDRNQGKDMADFLIKLDWREFRKSSSINKTIQESSILSKSVNGVKCEAPNKPLYLVQTIDSISNTRPRTNINHGKNWKKDIADLELFFSEAKLPKGTLQLNPHTLIHNLTQFIDSHVIFIRSNQGRNAFLPYLERLKELKFWLKNRN